MKTRKSNTNDCHTEAGERGEEVAGYNMREEEDAKG